jgi:hypothetical protein
MGGEGNLNLELCFMFHRVQCPISDINVVQALCDLARYVAQFVLNLALAYRAITCITPCVYRTKSAISPDK